MPHFSKYILFIIVVVSIMLGACEKEKPTNPVDITKDTTNKDTVGKDTIIKDTVIKDTVVKDTIIKDTIIPITKSFFEAEFKGNFYERFIYKEGPEYYFTYSDSNNVLRLVVNSYSKECKSIRLSISIGNFFNKIGTYKGLNSYYSSVTLKNRKINDNAYGSWGHDTSYVTITKNDDKTIEGKFYLWHTAMSGDPMNKTYLIANGQFGYIKK